MWIKRVPTKELRIPITFGRKDLEKLAHKCERGCDTYEEIGTRVHCDVFVTVHGMSAPLLCLLCATDGRIIHVSPT